MPEETFVASNLMKKNEIDLASQGIDREQAEALRASLATFSEDWESPEMSIYDSYDAASEHNFGL